MKNKEVSLRPIQIAAHLLAWVVAAIVLNNMLGSHQEQVTIVNGGQYHVIPQPSLIPYYLVSLATKAMLIYGFARLIFPVWFNKKKFDTRVGLVLLSLTVVVLIEFLGYEIINYQYAKPQTEKVGDFQVIIVPDEDTKTEKSIFSVWNILLYALSLAIAVAWNFVRRRRMQEQQLLEPPHSHLPINSEISPKNDTPLPQAETGASTKYVTLKSGTQSHIVRIDEILFLKKEGNYFTVFTASKKIVIRQDMKAALQWLPVEIFRRVHRSYIVSIRQVKFIENHNIHIGNHKIPIGKSYIEDLSDMVTTIGK